MKKRLHSVACVGDPVCFGKAQYLITVILCKGMEIRPASSMI